MQLPQDYMLSSTVVVIFRITRPSFFQLPPDLLHIVVVFVVAGAAVAVALAVAALRLV